jgi:hypothetical protein
MSKVQISKQQLQLILDSNTPAHGRLGKKKHTSKISLGGHKKNRGSDLSFHDFYNDA